MKNNNILIQGKNISLRLITIEDIPDYYKRGFEIIDEETQRCTGTKHVPTEEQVEAYVKRIVEDDLRYDFLIIDSKGHIIGESVINEINPDTGCANFRIGIFKSENFGQGIGSEATALTIKFGFEEIKLHRIELEVFSFNERAYRAYRRAGFVEEGRLREAEIIDGKYCDVIVMGILREEYLKNS